MRLPAEFIEAIKDRLPVSAVVSQKVRLKKASAEWKGLSPFNAEKTPSFTVNDRKQFWHDFSSGRSGTIFDFVMLTQGVSFPAAVEILASMAGLTMPVGWRNKDYQPDPAYEAKMAPERAAFERQRTRKEAEEQRFKGNVRSIAHRIWNEGLPVGGTATESYLKRRGIDFGHQFKSLRHHRNLEHRDQETGEVTYWPALIAAVQAPDDRFMGIWRIWHDGGNSEKAFAKMGLGSCMGGCVRLGPPGEQNNVCEGIETALGVYGILAQSQGVQSALSSGGLRGYIPLLGCKRVLIWPDGDTDRIRADKTGEDRVTTSPGLKAGNDLLERLQSEGNVEASIQPTPKRGRDWLDIYNRGKNVDGRL